jgi:glycosyltransferase involved in cell wall biosynthesis
MVTFSVVVPTYNRAALLPRALDSVLHQTEPSFEIVVVDDGSTDDTEAVVRGYADERVRFLTQPNGGVCAARNTGARAAHGDRLVFLDSDDELVPDALARFRAAADDNGWAVVVSGWTRVSADERDHVSCVPERSGAAPQLVGPYLPGAFALDRAVFDAAGGYDELLRFGENTALGWRVREVLARTHQTVGMIHEPLVLRYSQPGRAFDRQRYEAAVRILDAYAAVLRDPVTGAAAPRHRRANFQGVAGSSAAALGLRREAWRYALAALRSEPDSLTRYRGLLAVALATTRRDGARQSKR